MLARTLCGSAARCSRQSQRSFNAEDAATFTNSALVVSLPEGHFVIEQAPIPDLNGESRGVVAEGPVGTRWAGRFRLFRYEVRCWREGSIPDIQDAIGSPVRLVDDLNHAQRIIHVLPSIPTRIWGRDELGTGEMWNSNSVTSWVLERGGVALWTVHPPSRGRAPGWNAGLAACALSTVA